MAADSLSIVAHKGNYLESELFQAEGFYVIICIGTQMSYFISSLFVLYYRFTWTKGRYGWEGCTWRERRPRIPRTKGREGGERTSRPWRSEWNSRSEWDSRSIRREGRDWNERYHKLPNFWVVQLQETVLYVSGTTKRLELLNRYR